MDSLHYLRHPLSNLNPLSNLRPTIYGMYSSKTQRISEFLNIFKYMRFLSTMDSLHYLRHRNINLTQRESCNHQLQLIFSTSTNSKNDLLIINWTPDLIWGQLHQNISNLSTSHAIINDTQNHTNICVLSNTHELHTPSPSFKYQQLND